MRSPSRVALLAVASGVAALATATTAFADGGATSYTAGTPAPVTISGGPWTLSQSGAVYPAAQGATGVVSPYPTGYAGAPGDLPDYCASGGASPENGLPVDQPVGSVLTMSPYYFPHVQTRTDGTLEGFFDYRPKDVTEAVVAAQSKDDGKSWLFQGMALEENAGSCPNGNSDTDLQTTNDDGQGHPFDITIGGTTYLYTLNRPSGDTVGSQLLVHTIDPNAANPLAGLPGAEPVGLGGSSTTTAAGTVTDAPGGTSTGADTTIPVASTANVEMPGRLYVAGTAVQCSGSTATAFTGCYVPASTPLTFRSGAATTADPVVPSTATTTTGLVAPDGILGVLPASTAIAGVPAGATTVLYIDKTLNGFAPTTTSATVALPLSNGSVPLAAPATYTASAASPVTIYLGGTADGIVPVSCTGTNSAGLTGCSTPSGTGTDTVSSGSTVGSAGACIVPSATLTSIGEGSTKAKTLYKNNEDLAQIRVAYTTNGTDFTDVTDSVGGVTGLASPSAQSGLRWVAPSGTIVTNPDGTLGIFYSAGACSDGDSDAFGSLYYATSTNGLTWSAPSTITATGTSNPTLSTDYTFAADRADQSDGLPADASGYYSGRIYSPSVVKNADGTYTMVFAGYRTPKPLPSVGSVLGRGAASYTVGSNDAALYRTIMAVTLTPTSGGPAPALPEATYAALIPLVGAGAGVGLVVARRRRRTVAIG